MSGMSETTEVLSLATILGGRTPRNQGWMEAIKEVRRDVVDLRKGVESNIKVNIEFHVPGNVLSPDFEGVRTGYFRKADSLIKVQVALPPDSPDDARPVLIGYLWAALDAVDAWRASKKGDFDTRPLRGLVAALESARK